MMITVEFIFLAFSIYFLIREFKTPCDSYNAGNLIKASAFTMCFAHGYNIFRLIYKIYYRFMSTKQEKASLWRCFLIDCYCCLSLCHYLVV